MAAFIFIGGGPDETFEKVEVFDLSDPLRRRKYTFTRNGTPVEVDDATAKKLAGNGHFKMAAPKPRVEKVKNGDVDSGKAAE